MIYGRESVVVVILNDIISEDINIDDVPDMGGKCNLLDYKIKREGGGAQHAISVERI